MGKLMFKMTWKAIWQRPLFLQLVGKARHLVWKLRLQAPPAPDPLTPDMQPQPLEGYADKLFYLPGQLISFHLKALHSGNRLLLQRRSFEGAWEHLTEYSFDQLPQPENFEEAQNGCHWSVSWTYTLQAQAMPGYYRAQLLNPGLPAPAEIHFLVGSAAPKATVAVLAPVSTWQAYNAYGGQSLYRNAIAAEVVPFVSTQRPNTALTYHRTTGHQHDLQIESQIYNWLSQHFHADLYPDYYLEAYPEIFSKYQVVVLAYHAEYFSVKMYTALRELVFQQKKSLLALGGNQVYWQTHWHQDFTRLECRKNGSFFQNSSKPGGMWRHTRHPEATLLGAQYTETGLGTYAPYQVLEPDHWLFENTDLTAGELFGESGIDGLPICGDETDKLTWSSPSGTVVLARGLNKAPSATGEEMEVYQSQNPQWNGAGGGEIAFTELSPRHAVLNTGSIQSGSGLGVDAAFTQLIRNFVQRYSLQENR
ncbi:MAG: N,N-dimethylformamidase beta subunit family domain-containing protein [Rufibacter sp.]